MHGSTLEGGFANPAHDAAQAFRAVMQAMAQPGSLQTVSGAQPPAPLSLAAGVALLTLCDTDTPLHLAGDADCDAVRSWVAFHTGAPIVGPSHCQFALGNWPALNPLQPYPLGSPDYPDRSATLIVELPELTAQGATLRGPGIKESATLSLPATAPFQANRALFPRGLDFIFCSGDQLAALPRSTKVI